MGSVISHAMSIRIFPSVQHSRTQIPLPQSFICFWNAHLVWPFFLITVWCLLALGFLVVGRWMLIPGLYLPNFSWCPPMVYDVHEHTFGLRCSRCLFGRRYLWVCVAVEFYRCRLFDFWTFFSPCFVCLLTLFLEIKLLFIVRLLCIIAKLLWQPLFES